MIHSEQPYLRTLYNSLFLTAYYELFRVGEITSGSHPVLAKDVHIVVNKRKLLFTLHTSKTHTKGHKPQFIRIMANGNDKKNKKYCAFLTFQRYLQMRQSGFLATMEPFFVFRDRSPVTPYHFRKAIHDCISRAGLDPHNYNSHSFRIGRSGDLLKKGVPIEIIRKLGRWSIRSNTVYTYLKSL